MSSRELLCFCHTKPPVHIGKSGVARYVLRTPNKNETKQRPNNIYKGIQLGIMATNDNSGDGFLDRQLPQ